MAQSSRERWIVGSAKPQARGNGGSSTMITIDKKILDRAGVNGVDSLPDELEYEYCVEGRREGTLIIDLSEQIEHE